MSHDVGFIHSNPGVRTDLMERQTTQIKVTDFFGSVQNFIPTKRIKNYAEPSIIQEIPLHSNEFRELERQHELPQQATLFQSWFLDILNKFI